MGQTDQQQLVIIAQPRLTDDWVTLRLEVNRNLSPNQQTWLYYGAKADEQNEERLATLMPHRTDGIVGKLLSRKSADSEPVDLETGVENYVRHLLLLDVPEGCSEEPEVLE